LVGDTAREGAEAINRAIDAIESGNPLEGIEKSIEKWTGIGADEMIRIGDDDVRDIAQEAGSLFGSEASEAAADELPFTDPGMYDPAVTAAGAAGDAAGGAFKKALSKWFKEVKKALDEMLKNIVDRIMNVYDKQTDAVVAAYDAQTQAIKDVIEEENRLSKEIAYQTNRRKAIREGALRHEQYVRSRALAIYEGRIDDARNLDLTEKKESENHTRKVSDIDEDRRKDIVAEERKTAIETIEIERDAFIERRTLLKTFLQDQLDAIIEFTPKTVDEWNSMMDEIKEVVSTSLSSDEMLGYVDDFSNALNTSVNTDKLRDNLSAVHQDIIDMFDGDSEDSVTAIIGKANETLEKIFQTAFDRANDVLINAYEWMPELGFLDWMIPYMDPIITQFESRLAKMTAAMKEISEFDPTNLDPWTHVDTDPLGNDGQGSGLWYGGDYEYTTRAPLPEGANWGRPSNVGSAAGAYTGTVRAGLRYGGKVSAQYGRYLGGYKSSMVPVMAHGGEFIMNAKATQSIGVKTLSNMNNFGKIEGPNGAGNTTNANSVTINVDTFVGQREWFDSMMSDYNINVAPNAERVGGIENRTVGSYVEQNLRSRV
jgi:hypothetical protein